MSIAEHVKNIQQFEQTLDKVLENRGCYGHLEWIATSEYVFEEITNIPEECLYLDDPYDGFVQSFFNNIVSEKISAGFISEVNIVFNDPPDSTIAVDDIDIRTKLWSIIPHKANLKKLINLIVRHLPSRDVENNYRYKRACDLWSLIHEDKPLESLDFFRLYCFSNKGEDVEREVKLVINFHLALSQLGVSKAIAKTVYGYHRENVQEQSLLDIFYEMIAESYNYEYCEVEKAMYDDNCNLRFTALDEWEKFINACESDKHFDGNTYISLA